jgi:hypothetical protein
MYVARNTRPQQAIGVGSLQHALDGTLPTAAIVVKQIAMGVTLKPMSECITQPMGRNAMIATHVITLVALRVRLSHSTNVYGAIDCHSNVSEADAKQESPCGTNSYEALYFDDKDSCRGDVQ